VRASVTIASTLCANSASETRRPDGVGPFGWTASASIFGRDAHSARRQSWTRRIRRHQLERSRWIWAAYSESRKSIAGR
jgi:hypothetical protein